MDTVSYAVIFPFQGCGRRLTADIISRSVQS